VPALRHAGYDGGGENPHRAHHDRVGVVLLFVVGGRQLAETAEAGVVHQDVDGLGRVGQTLRDACGVLRVREVGDEHLDGSAERAQLGGHRIQSLLVARDQHEVVATGSELPRELGSDARSSSGDQSDTHGPYDTVQVRTVLATDAYARPERAFTMTPRSTTTSDAGTSLETGGFDVREFARTAQGRFRAELDLAAINSASLGADALRLLRLLRDLERSTMHRMRNLLVTATHKDARVTAFLTTWAFEKFWIADALDAVLEAGDQEHSVALVGADAALRHTVAEHAERRGPIRRAISANFAGPQIVAAHVTTGLTDEWITQAAYRRLGELAEGLHAVIDRIVAIKDRHIRFLAEEAQRRLAASPRASKLTRLEIKRAAWPIGAVDRSGEDRTFFETIVFGTPEGAAEAGRISALLGALPGLSSVAPTVSARLVP